MLLYHYYEKSKGPFLNLSSLTIDEANRLQAEFKQEGIIFASQRDSDYIQIRMELEQKAREMFMQKGGKPNCKYPHYLTLGACPWLKSWYKQGEELVISLQDLNVESISFTYGDLFPTMRYKDDKPYREMVYTLPEILDLVEQYGLPQDWNYDGSKGPERYIEVQLWDDDIIGGMLRQQLDVF